MKRLIYILLLILISKSICNAQIPQDYPFKTYMDEIGNLYFTGVENGDIVTKKYPPINPNYFDPLWSRPFVNAGYDRSYDIAIDPGGYVYVTGYIVGEKNSNDIILIKYDISSGLILETKKFGGVYDDKAYGVTVDDEQNVYLTGYKSINSYSNSKNLITLKYNRNGILQFQHEYDNEKYRGDDVGTDILVDKGHLYVTGYTYEGPIKLTDIILFTYNKDNLIVTDSTKYKRNYTNEVPTSFLFSELSTTIVDKSRLAISSLTDNPVIQNNSDYLTLCFEGGQYNRLAWSKILNGTGNGNDVATDMSADANGNVYVTGYSYRGIINKYDFATIKYNNAVGDLGWNDTVKYFNYGGVSGNGEDKASSIKTRHNKIYVSGTSQNAPNGIYTVIYEQNNGIITNTWDRVFYPSFTKSDTYETMNKASQLYIDSSGNLVVIAFAWNASVAKYAAIKYDSLGNVLYVLDENGSNRESDSQISEQINSEKFHLEQNFPNPFNPVTKINYQLPASNNVSLKVYDIIGNEVATLVSGNQNPGSYSLSFDGSIYPSGIYFYKLVLNGSVVDIKRMILLK